MRCYQHQEARAIGICRGCNKGVCAQCSIGKLAIACSDACNEYVEHERILIKRSVELYGSKSQRLPIIIGIMVIAPLILAFFSNHLKNNIVLDLIFVCCSIVFLFTIGWIRSRPFKNS